MTGEHKEEGIRERALLIGALPRGGNHLLRGLLDAHSSLVLPPDEDYFVRNLLRNPVRLARGLVTSPGRAPAFYRMLQKNGHLELVSAGRAKNSFDTHGILDLPQYYDHVRTHHRPFSVKSMIRTHFGAMEAALGVDWEDIGSNQRARVAFCALQSDKRDALSIGRVLSSMYELRGVFVVRDPRTHFGSKLGRKPDSSLQRFCHDQNEYWRQIDLFEQRYAPALRVRFEELVTDTDTTMRRVCDFAGIPFSLNCTQFTQAGEPTLSNSSFNNVRGIDAGALTRSREVVPPEAIEYIEQHCRPELFWNRSEARAAA